MIFGLLSRVESLVACSLYASLSLVLLCVVLLGDSVSSQSVPKLAHRRPISSMCAAHQRTLSSGRGDSFVVTCPKGAGLEPSALFTFHRN